MPTGVPSRSPWRGLEALSRRERAAVRHVVVGATCNAYRPEVAVRLETFVDQVPLEAIAASASLHRVVGPVRHSLQRTDRDLETVLVTLRRLSTASALAHLRFVGVLAEIADDFDGAGLKWLVMKGPVLAGAYYPDVGDRAYSDLDLLVDRFDFPIAVQILERLGYEHRIRNWALAEAMLAGQLTMMRGPVRIDLHWHLHYARDDRRRLDVRPSEMIARARRTLVSGIELPTFDAVDTVLTIAFHAARSDGHALVWAKDIERVIARDGLDSGELIERCHRARCAPAVGVMLTRSRDLVRADVPALTTDRLVPEPIAILDRMARRVSPVVQLRQENTVTRFVTRSIGPSTSETLAAFPRRTARLLQRRFHPPPVNESDDPDEKRAYLEAVASSIES